MIFAQLAEPLQQPGWTETIVMIRAHGKDADASTPPDSLQRSTSTSVVTIQTEVGTLVYPIATLTLNIVDGTFTIPVTASANVPHSDASTPGSLTWSVIPSIFFPSDAGTARLSQTPILSSRSEASQAVVTDTITLVTTSAMGPTVSPPSFVSTQTSVYTPSQFRTASSNAAVPSAKSGVSTGALAGVAVACFTVGVITAALVLWASRSRRRGRRSNRFSSSATAIIVGASEDSSHNGHKYLPMMPVSAKTPDKALPPVAGLGHHEQEKEDDPVMPPLAPSQPATTTYPPSSFAIKRKRVSATSTSALTGRSVDVSDRTFSELRTQVKTIFEQLDMHVDNFYTEASGVPLTGDYRHNLQQLDSPYLPDSIIGLLPEVSGHKIKPLIKHCLAYAIFSRIGGSSTRVDNDDILLPSGLAAITQAIQPSPTTRVKNPETYEQHIDRLLMWKHETVAMMDAHTVVKSAGMQSKISKLAWKCVKGLEPWSLARYGTEAKKSHLVRAIEEAVELGLHVFGEKKGRLVWQWEQNPTDTREVAKVGDFVLFPGLELRKELGNGRAGSRADGESERNVGAIGSAREVVLAPTMAST